MEIVFDTPILLIAFNRPDHVTRVLKNIRGVKPLELYVALDGPRHDRTDDNAKIQAVKDVIADLVDWPCNLHTLFQEKNLGCGPGPYAAISWFFGNVEYGIILEDDLEPHPLFYKYCSDLLERYRDDSRVGLITAHNKGRVYHGNTSYYFTFDMGGTLGWGTWRRVWESFDFNIQYDAEQLDQSLKRFYGLPKPYRDHENHLYNIWITGSRHDMWDHQFKYYLMTNGYLDAKPNSCLVSHLGTDEDATHQGYCDPGYLMDVDERLFEKIYHPKYVKIALAERWRIVIKSCKIRIKRILHLIDY